MPKRARGSVEEGAAAGHVYAGNEDVYAGNEHVYADNEHVAALSAGDQAAAAAVAITPGSPPSAVLLEPEETKKNTGHGGPRDDTVPGLFPPAADDPPLTTIHNLVGTCEIFSSVMPIDLEFVYKSLPNSFYDRKRFAAITIRVTQPVCTGLLFTSGKLVVTGCKTLVVSLAPRHPPKPKPKPHPGPLDVTGRA
jgi:hypothetical protein